MPLSFGIRLKRDPTLPNNHVYLNKSNNCIEHSWRNVWLSGYQIRYRFFIRIRGISIPSELQQKLKLVFQATHVTRIQRGTGEGIFLLRNEHRHSRSSFLVCSELYRSQFIIRYIRSRAAALIDLPARLKATTSLSKIGFSGG